MDPQSDAEKLLTPVQIRNKRLAKLGNTAAPSEPGNDKSSSVPSASTQPAPPTNPRPESAVLSSVTQPATPRQPRLDPPKLSAAPKVTASHTSIAATESLETWTDRTLSSIFRVTLQPSPKQDGGHRVVFLPGVREELEESGTEIRLSADSLDGAIIEAASNTQDGKPLLYLLGCWKRVIRVLRNVRGSSGDEQKVEVLKEAKRLCMSYCIFAVTLPDMFGVEATTRSPLLDHILRDPESDAGICHDFLAEAVSRMPEDDTIREVLVTAAEQLSIDLSKLTMNDSFKSHVKALKTLVRYQPLATAITESPIFLPQDVEPQMIEKASLLGPFFALSPLDGSVAENYFRGSEAQGEAFVRSNQDAVRNTLRTHQEELLFITNCIVKAGKEPRERMLDWFALVVNKNHKRRAMYVQHNTVASHGFMINVTTILDQLCEPFMDPSFSKLDRVDVNYLRRSPRVSIDDETKLNADDQTSKDFYAQKADGENHFISEIFFLTLAAHHYGTDSANNQITSMQREIKHMESQLQKFVEERAKLTNPMQLAMLDQHHKRYQDTLQRAKSVLKALQGILLDELVQSRSILLMRYVIAWLLRLLQPETRYPQKPVKLPLAEEQPLVFRCLPEYFVEDIVDNFKFVTNQMPHIILPTQCEELVTVCITFLRSSEYIKNPGIKSGLVSILFHGIWPVRGRAKGVLGDLLHSSKFCHEHLLHALMKFYIEAENTGVSSAFYDKFNIRYEIFQVIRCIWPNSIYRNKLDTESKVHVEFFVRFVNLLLNDVTYVLGESFSAFNRINALQSELKSPALTNEEREQKESDLSDQQRKAKGNMQLTNETVSMLKLFTEVLAPAFTMPEIVQRLADMLDYNLEAMVGPKQRDLKVENPDQYFFKPRALLSDLMSVYVNLKDQTSFHVAVARDGRSYKPYNFTHAAEIMQQGAYKTPEELKTWHQLAATIAAAKEVEDQADEDLGDVPDEFLDPILATVMEDPVLLPISRQTVDRSTIRSHLLSDPHDPFNRTPLKIEDVIPNTELKEQIEEFKANARKRKFDALQQTSSTNVTGESMDTS